MKTVGALFLTLTFFLPTVWAQDDMLEKIATGKLEFGGLSSHQHEQLIKTLAARLLIAEHRIGQLEKQVASDGGNGAAEISEERIKAIQAEYEEIRKLHSALRFDEMARAMKAFEAEFPEIEGSQAYKKFKDEVAVIGKPALEPEVTEWFQAGTRLSEANVTLLVFWETWCPHCQDEMPRMQQLFERYQEQGLQIIGLTRMTNDATVSDVIGFIANTGVTFGIGKVGEGTLDDYGVAGVPAAAIAKNGKIIWRGNPERITDLTISRAMP